jgi:hypothetical protein
MNDDHLNLTHPPATLDGHTARIGGYEHRKQKYALVWAIHMPCLQAQFAWPTVDRIMAKGGNFRTQ